MRIHSMTATFGKLEHDTLTLEPGLNVIHAPNEWGKSTWCAFLLAMLYGLDTRAKSTRAGLSDKEHYAPWSGSPMSGRIDLSWEGRNITIERTTKGRIPMGAFRAYETDTGLEIPELNAANCGQMLLGVERSVFQRAGFIRLSDLPVSQDDALRQRLNALVTTGDESGDGARLEKGLRELKNRCRYNHSGLLPQAEQERDTLEETLQEQEALELQCTQIDARREENAQLLAALENHAAALAFEAANEDARKVAEAESAYREHQQKLAALEAAPLPSRAEIAQKLERLNRLAEQARHVQFRHQNLPIPPKAPEIPKPFLGLTPEEAVAQVREDTQKWNSQGSALWILFLLLSAAGLGGAAYLYYTNEMLRAAVPAGFGLVMLLISIVLIVSKNGKRRAIANRYGSDSPEEWVELAREYTEDFHDFHRREQAYRTARADLEEAVAEVKRAQEQLCGGQTVGDALRYWQRQSAQRDALDNARREAAQTMHQWQTLQAMAKPMPGQVETDSLTLSPAETRQQIRDAQAEAQHLGTLLGQYRGRSEAMGSRETMLHRLDQLNRRIASLEETAAALTLAQQTLAQASAELQRRFAPRISRRAQGILGQLTAGRYDRLMLGSDLSIQAGANQEDTLRDAQWRSEGTIDQLYLTLRLAVAEELTPEAPLILDDALVRFDEDRMTAAMEILQSLSETRQVILFTCQERERKAMSGLFRRKGATL